MEVGAVKQAFNNELILLKKNLNQARIQIIHKLTRKAKQLTEKKAPEALTEKFRRKAESAVKEVLIIKKIKARDIGKFSITHTGKLQDYLNKAQVDNDKACARLLLHKALQEKYKSIRNRFSNIPIKDLFMSRQERIKLKKEEQQKKKDKKKGKGKVVNAEGDWDVEDVAIGNKKLTDKIAVSSNDEDMSGDEIDSPQQDLEPDSDQQETEESTNDADGESHDENSEHEANVNEIEESGDNESEEDVTEDMESPSKPITVLKEKKTVSTINTEPIEKNITKLNPKEIVRNKSERKQKDINKNKNLNEKILKKKFKKDLNDGPNVETKVIDPFFKTATGDNYMSIAEPRQPDQFKEEHRQGNRQLRRAVMFGHVPKIKPRQNFGQDKNRNERSDKFGRQKFDKQSDRQNSYDRSNNRFDQQNGYQRNNNKFNRSNDKFDDSKTRNDRNNRKSEESKPEKLHPSWEAKKKQSGILPFQGKKIVFNDS